MTIPAMSRRHFVNGLMLMPLIGCSPAANALQASGPTLNVVEAFGFVPDGRTDNHDAFLRWARHVNGSRGGSYRFPPGTYAVHRYRNGPTGSPAPGGAQLPEVRNASGLEIFGEGARIDLNGNFHRSARTGRNGRPVGAEVATFMPFVLSDCRDVRIRGFEIDGGVRAMSRDSDVAEAYSHLIALHGCTNVLLEHLHLHHSQTDAIYLAASHHHAAARACRNIVLRNVRCLNNGRGGLGIIQALGVSSTDCEFSGSGTDLGSYEGHSPRFGVTVEPDYSPPVVDVRSGDVSFHGCEFHGNGTAFAGVYPDRVQGHFRLIDCRSSNTQGSNFPIMINWPGALIEGGVHDGGKGTIWTSWDGPGGGELTIRNCEIRTSAPYGLFHAHPGNIVHLDNVRILGQHRTAAETGWVLALQGNPGGGRRNSLRNCELFIPAARKNRAAPYDYEVSFYHTLSEGNRFLTDLPARSGEHFCTEYGPGAVASSDVYSGTARGPGDSFRPSHGSAHDSRRPFSHH